MTETTTTAPGPTTAPRPLYRDPESAKLAGVCGAVARYTDTDPVIWRIITAVLAVFGGTGVVLYLVGWLVIPRRAADGSVPDSWLARRSSTAHPAAGAAVIAVVALVVLGGIDHGQGVGIAAVVAVVAYLVYRDRQGRPLTGPYPATSYPAASYPAAGTPSTYAPVPPPERLPRERAPRDRSRLGLLTVSVAALLTGALSWAALAGAGGLSAPRIAAAALLVVGAGLVVGTWYGRARWLVVIGLLLSLFLGASAAFTYAGGTLHGGVGSRTWVVAADRSDQSFALGIGEATLDLSALPAGGPPVVVRSTVSLGHLIILVPPDVPIRVHAKARIGDITEFGQSLVSGEGSLERTRSYGPAADPRVQVEATIGSGQIEVRHA